MRCGRQGVKKALLGRSTSLSLRILVLNTDYGEFLNWFYGQRTELQSASYAEQLQERMMSRFGVADFYSNNLRRLGHEVWDVHANNAFMQQAWARENGLCVDGPDARQSPLQALLQRCNRSGVARTPLRHLKRYCSALLGSNNSEPEWSYRILAAQIKKYRPDVLLNQAMDGISNRFLSDMKPHVKLLVGQHAAPLPSNEEFSAYDLVLSSLPNFVAYFRKMGLPAALHRLAFEPRLLDDLENGGQEISVCFVGSLSTHHNSRLELLEYLCGRLDVKVWGPDPYGLPRNSSIRRSYMGQLWGRDMYQMLRHAKITLNHHIGIASCYANNMRLFESTGVGSLLLTDWKQNLSEMFEPGKEVVAYRTPEECLERMEYYLAHEEERASIARNGQQRTLREHNYRDRMGEFVEIVREYI
jgi:spore maturation protein CgeB